MEESLLQPGHHLLPAITLWALEMLKEMQPQDLLVHRHLELCLLNPHPLLGLLRRSTARTPSSPASYKGKPLC